MQKKLKLPPEYHDRANELFTVRLPYKKCQLCNKAEE